MRKALFFCAVPFWLVLSDAVVAAEWSIEPSVSVYEEYNDNIHFSNQPHPSVWMTRISPKAKLSGKTEVSEISGSAQLNFNRFVGEQGLDRNDQLFSLLASHMSERNTWGMMASYIQDSTSESERIATGLVQTRTQRSVLSLTPSWNRSLTERSSFKLDYNYQDVKYASHINLNDYTYQLAGGALQYQWSERDQVTVSTNYTVVEYAPVSGSYASNFPVYDYGVGGYVSFSGSGDGTDTVINKSSNRNVQVGLTHLFSTTLKGSLSLGARSTVNQATHTCNGDLNRISAFTHTFCTGSHFYPIITFANEVSGNAASYNATLDKQFETGKVSGMASRDVAPSGSGVVETDRFAVALYKNLTENLTGYLDATVYRTRFLSVAGTDSRYATIEPRLNWRFTEWWMLDVGYRYAQFNAASATVANAVYLNLTYSWPKIAVSR